MSLQYPPPCGHTPGASASPPTHPALSPYAAPPAGFPAYGSGPQASSQGEAFNPWVAALLGSMLGAVLTALVGVVFLVSSGFPMPWEGPDDWVEDWSGQVEVAADGSVPGTVLADAVRELGGGGFYEDVSCPETPKVAADVTTLCAVDDGYDRYRVVVVFLDDTGAFESADIFAP